MYKKTQNIKKQLKALGPIVGLEEPDIELARKTTKTMLCMWFFICLFTLLGLMSSRLEAVGLWYVGVSIQDFGLLGSFF